MCYISCTNMNILLICTLLLATITTTLVVLSFASHSLEDSEKTDIGFFSSLSRNINQTIGGIQDNNVITNNNTG
jgi:hypothetical protein